MNKKKKGKYVGVLGTVIAHVALIGILLLVSFALPDEQEESGVPVILGDTTDSQYDYDPATMVDVEIMNVPQELDLSSMDISEEDLITQKEEETIAVKEETSKKEQPKKEPIKKIEKTEAEKRAEAKRLAEEKAERERKAAADAAAKRVSGAFGKGSKMDVNQGTTAAGTGVEGSHNGNSAQGAKEGMGGYGTFDLGGRSLGEGGLPRPVYNVQEEGRVVVTITVNPAGLVIDATINLNQTKTMSSALRQAALNAAKKARFNTVSGLNNQIGTITYFFNLK